MAHGCHNKEAYPGDVTGKTGVYLLEARLGQELCLLHPLRARAEEYRAQEAVFPGLSLNAFDAYRSHGDPTASSGRADAPASPWVINNVAQEMPKVVYYRFGLCSQHNKKWIINVAAKGGPAFLSDIIGPSQRNDAMRRWNQESKVRASHAASAHTSRLNSKPPLPPPPPPPPWGSSFAFC
jgi:hypothetical protein